MAQNASVKLNTLPELFPGERGWMEWFDHFESVAAVNNWKDTAKALWLCVCHCLLRSWPSTADLSIFHKVQCMKKALYSHWTEGS